MPCASSIIHPTYHLWLTIFLYKVLRTIGFYFLSHFLFSVSLPSTNSVRWPPPNWMLFSRFLVIILMASWFCCCSSRCNPSWWTYYHTETPLHWPVRNWNPIVLVGRAVWNILLVDWSLEYTGPQSCVLTRTRCRKWLCYHPGNRMRAGERSSGPLLLLI